jgi:hypothetical protein
LSAGAVVALGVMACSSEDGAEALRPTGAGRTTTVSEARRAGSSEAATFAFFAATREGRGYRVVAVNGARFACGSEASATSCLVGDVDLSGLGLSSTSTRALAEQIGWRDDAPQLLFAGQMTRGALAVTEVWRAPAPAPLTGTLLHVSHDPAQALVVNDWAPVALGSVDLTSAPDASECFEDEGGQLCKPTLDAATTDVTSTAGVIVLGRFGDGGALHVTQYFLKVSTGYTQDGDGYSYCLDGQIVCPNLTCLDDDAGGCHGLHWGGRGETPDPRTYVRASSPSFSAWLLATGQVQASDGPLGN